jgi:hypothetical protein
LPFAGRTGQGDSLSRLPGLDAAAWNALDLGVQMAAVPPAGRRRESGHIVRLPGSFPRLRRSRRCRIRGASSSRSGTLPTFQSASRLQTARKDLRRPLVPRFNLPKCAPSGTSGSAPTFGWPPCLVLAAVPARHQRTVQTILSIRLFVAGPARRYGVDPRRRTSGSLRAKLAFKSTFHGRLPVHKQPFLEQ